MDRFESIMRMDIANQAKGYIKNRAGYLTAEEALRMFKEDPAQWVTNNLQFK